MPKPQPPPYPEVSAVDQWLGDCYRLLVDHNGGRAPTIEELAAFCDRSKSGVSRALQQLGAAGLLARGGRYNARASSTATMSRGGR